MSEHEPIEFRQITVPERYKWTAVKEFGAQGFRIEAEEVLPGTDPGLVGEQDLKLVFSRVFIPPRKVGKPTSMRETLGL